MTHRLITAIVTLGLSVLVVGCAAGPEPGWEQRLVSAIEDRTDAFTSAPELLAGFDRIEPGRELDVGDELLFGVELRTGARRRVWYLRISVAEIRSRRWLFWRGVQDFESRITSPQARRNTAEAALAKPVSLDELSSEIPVARVRVEAFDSTGKLLGAAESEESVGRLMTGLHRACIAGHAQRDLMHGRVAQGRDAEPIEVEDWVYADVMTVADGIAACDGFFAILQSNPVTRSILFEVIALPSLWSIICNLGVKAGFGIDFFAAERVTRACFSSTQQELWSVPMTIELNDQPALLTRIIAGPSSSPSAAAAGVYGLVGRHPTDSGRSVHVQLLATRRE